MGHSFVEVGDRGVWLNDACLTLIRHFVEREGNRLLAEPGHPPGRRESFEAFLGGFTDCGPGVFLVDFGPLTASEDGRAFLLAVFDRVGQALRGYGGHIPEAYLRENVNSHGTQFTRDVPAGVMLAALGQVWGLFSYRG